MTRCVVVIVALGFHVAVEIDSGASAIDDKQRVPRSG